MGITSLAPERRWQNGYGYHRNKHFYGAILQYGWDNFSHEIICEGLSKEAACSKEIELIEKYKTNDPQFGYNNSIGGEYGSLGCHLSEEVRKRLSEQAKLRVGEKHPMYGKPLSEETRRKLSESKKGKYGGEKAGFYGKHHSEETRKLLSEQHKGLKHSEETRIKMSESRKGKRHSEATRKKMSENNAASRKVINLDTGEIFDTVTKAANKYNITRSNIAAACNGRQNTAAHFHWSYFEEND